jgi:lia operon protein LiaF
MRSTNLGLLLVAIGAVYLADNLGLGGFHIQHPALVGLWPLIPLLIGLNSVTEAVSRTWSGRGPGKLYRGDMRQVASGFFWIVLGAAFLIRNLGLWHWSVSASALLGPIVLVWVGVQLMTKPGHHGHKSPGKHNGEGVGQVFSGDVLGRGDMSGVVGELRIRDPWTLTDNDVSLWVGEISVDVTKALMPNRDSHLQVSAMAGECTITVPRELAVSVTAELFAGEIRALEQYRAGMLPKVSFRTPGFDEAEKRLTLDIKMKFGEITVRAV